MAIQNITYDDKVSIQTSSLPNANKCRAEDLNEIKSVVNNNANELDTRGIVESGSNADGNYIKYGDGTMICWKTKTVSATCTQAWGSLYQHNANNGIVDIGNYAQEFIAIPSIQATVNNKNNGAGAIIARIADSTTTSFGGIVLLRPVSTGSGNYDIDLMAVGKWK